MPCWCKNSCPNIAAPRELLRLQRPYEAEAACNRILVDAPNCAEINLLLAHIMVETNRAAFAWPHLIRARETAGETPAVLCAIGANHRAEGHLEFAVDAFRAALETLETPFAYAGLVGALEHAGDYDQAEHWLERAYLKFPYARDLRRLAGLILAHKAEYGAAIALLSGDLVPMELMDRGRYKEKLGDYAGAWSDWMDAKRELKRRFGHHYRRELVQGMVAGYRELSGRERRKLIAIAAPAGAPAPLFVTGFPRSGTTLVETILSNHPLVAAGDELMMLAELVQRIAPMCLAGAPYPLALMALASGDNQAMPDLLRDYYLTRARLKIGAAPGANFFTDKMPLNEVHLPLMRILFPASPIVHVRRHPLDVIVSNMSHVITHGYFYAESLETAAENYALVAELVEHYRRAYAGEFFELKYESLVLDQLGETDRLLKACGLDLDPRCLAPQSNPRFSRTISYRQVKVPVNASAIGRYKPFVKFLAPIVDQLMPAMAREGYAL